MLDVGDLVRLSKYQVDFSDWAREAWENKEVFLLIKIDSPWVSSGVWVVKLNDLNGRRFFIRRNQLEKVEQ